MVKSPTLSLLGLAVLQGVMAVPAPTVYPEVIPGPGLPSLAELNITSAQLYEMGLPEGRVRHRPFCFPFSMATSDVCADC
jgi:hypothetical protein